MRKIDAENRGEYWAMAVLAPASEQAMRRYGKALAAGELGVVNGDICEPLSVHLGDQDAATAAALAHTARTGMPCKVVMMLSIE